MGTCAQEIYNNIRANIPEVGADSLGVQKKVNQKNKPYLWRDKAERLIKTKNKLT